MAEIRKPNILIGCWQSYIVSAGDKGSLLILCLLLFWSFVFLLFFIRFAYAFICPLINSLTVITSGFVNLSPSSLLPVSIRMWLGYFHWTSSHCNSYSMLFMTLSAVYSLFNVMAWCCLVVFLFFLDSKKKLCCFFVSWICLLFFIDNWIFVLLFGCWPCPLTKCFQNLYQLNH